MRLIDFDKLEKTVKECSGNWTLPQQEGAELMLDIAEYLAEENEGFALVRHGHWIDCEDEYSSYVRCSVCGDEYTNWEADCAHTDFCPGCGADMRGADNETD